MRVHYWRLVDGHGEKSLLGADSNDQHPATCEERLKARVTRVVETAHNNKQVDRRTDGGADGRTNKQTRMQRDRRRE